MEGMEIFDGFRLDDLDENWIKSIWDSEFLIYHEPPEEYLVFSESESMRLLLHESCSIVKKWLAEIMGHNGLEHRGTDLSWSTLIALDVRIRGLLAVMGYVMKSGQSKDADEDARQSCLYATSLYFLLVAIPGSTAFNVFHPNLYQRAFETFKMAKYLLPVIRKGNKATSVECANGDDEFVSDNVLCAVEKGNLERNLNDIVCNFIIMLGTFWFKDHLQSLDITVQGLLEVTKVESDGTESFTQRGWRNSSSCSLSSNAYLALRELCDSKHGPVHVTIMFIAKYILPRLICSHLDAQLKLVACIREASVNFLKILLDRHEKDTKNAVVILIQHLMLKCPERLEARQKQATVLLKLLSICKQNILLEAFKNVVLLSHHSKIPCRIFAQEIIGKCLTEPFLLECDMTESLKLRVKTTLFAIVLGRCMDCSSMVRGKAMATVAEFTDSNNNTNETILRSMFEKSDPNKPFSTFEDMKRAMLEDKELLPGSNVLIAMFAARVEDERALVRRSTLQIFKNLSMMFPTLINDAIPIISRRCRDPTLTVRRFSVQLLSQLLQEFPDHSELLNEWVRAVIPQIFDIEIKVQEKVLEYLHELLLNRIKNISTCTNNNANSLPWKILTTLTSMKMRKHLSKACSLWVKNGTITKSVVLNIQSHIGTSNNIAAWVFLAALAENTELPSMDKYISNYEELLEDNDFHTSLVLQVLRYSWSSLDSAVLKRLHVYLYECLQKFKINFGLVSICLDIISTVTGHLYPNECNELMQSSMLKLMNLCETQIAKILQKESEAAEAAPYCLRAIFTLGHSTLLCSSKISPLTLRILEGLLLEWEALPKAIKEIDELQASVVVILGQLAMRDREVAQEVIPIFGRLLQQETNLSSEVHIAVKINSAKALADICVRFTALVEPYLSDMCVSMKDSSPHVREAIMVIFIQLLLEDFIKVKGPFFFHILTMLSDTDDMIRELTVFLIEERLLVKNKTLISQQFVQGIYHYNNYQAQHKFYDRKMREKEKVALTLPGKRNEEKRRIIYDFMLEHLDPPGKIKLFVKVTSQILCGTCIGALDVRQEEGAYVLKDALYIIGNERLHPSSLNKHTDDDLQDQEETSAQTTVNPAANAINIIVEGIKKHSLEILLPVLVKLRIKLSKLKSTLENDAKRLLVKVYSEYSKEQLASISNEYPNLEKEVEQFRRQVGDISSEDENTSEGSSSTSDTNIGLNFDRNIVPSILSPRIVLQRLSPSELSSFQGASRVSSTQFSSSTSVDSLRSPTRSSPKLRFNSPPPQPGPSTSTPKLSSHADSDLENTSGYSSRARRLSSFFPDADALNYSEFNPAIRDDSDSD